MSESVRIVEVGPRDGLQNEKTPVGVADRTAFVEALVVAGLPIVEVGAFVSPKAVPQMQGSDEVLRAAPKPGMCGRGPALLPSASAAVVSSPR